jgi:signal transduction histidine kinase
MRLADFIIQNMEPILQQWEDFARTLGPAADGMDAIALRDHAEHMLRNIAVDLQTFQSPEARILKSHGNAPSSNNVTSAETHADLRHASGFTIDQVIAEYRALRTSVLALWLPPDHVSRDQEVSDVIRFNEAIDQALAESVVTYASAVETTRNVFLGVLGHDLRSPLGAISLSAEALLRAGDLAPKPNKNVSHIYTSVKRSIKIVGDLLDFTRTQLGSGIPVRIESNDLALMCKEMVEEAKAYHPDRQIDLHSRSTLSWRFDRSRMEQVLTNLIGNAIQHGEANAPITVVLEAADGHASLSVHNSGWPIDNSARASLFNPLTRHLRSDDDKYGAEAGLGLGLFIASAIVSAHQGQIDVQSEADSGTIFTVRLPMNLP